MGAAAVASSITVHAPQVPVAASPCDSARLLDLCRKNRHVQKHNPDTLEQAARAAGLGGSVYYTGVKEDGKKYKVLMPTEVVVAKILEKEERFAAIPTGWLTVPPYQHKSVSRSPSPPVATCEGQSVPRSGSCCAVCMEAMLNLLWAHAKVCLAQGLSRNP